MARGDHIKVYRLGRLYAHHGIDMGDGTVIHFAGEPFRSHRSLVERTDMKDFLAGGTPRVVRYHGSARTVEEVLAAAEAQLHAGDYCMFRNNCEHFASYCKTGKMKSHQIRRLVAVMGATTSLAILAGVSISRSITHRASSE